MSSAAVNLRVVPQLEPLHSADGLMGLRTSREKVAILLAALSKETAVSLLQKLDTHSIKQLLASAGSLGDLNTGDFDPVAQEFTSEFADALGISAGSEQLMPLIEAAFSQEKVSQLLGLSGAVAKNSVWIKFNSDMQAAVVPFLLDEHEQTSAIVLSKLPVDLAAKCFALLPREIVPRILARSLKLRAVAPDVLAALEQTVEEHFFGEKKEDESGIWIERVANVVNRMERGMALAMLETLNTTSPEQARKLRAFIFMFEDVERMEQKSRARLFDRISAELVTPALWGMPQGFKEAVLSALSARARRMVESELGSDDGTPRADSEGARKKIAETAIVMGRKGELVLPELSSAEPQAS
jgi:flagellar motor switch protein FliG